MLISLKHRLAFLAVPKTGTTAIEAAFRKHSQITFRGSTKIKHTNAEGFDTLLRPFLAMAGFPDIQSFAVMRDPIDHLQSWYFYRRRLDEGSKPRNIPNSTKDITLEQFIEDFLSEPRPKHATIGSQARFLCGGSWQAGATGETVRPLVDIIFPYERLNDAISFVADRVGETITVERKNTSKREAVDIAPALLARLEARLAPDIALYRRVQAGEFLPDTPHALARLHAAGKGPGPGGKRRMGRVGGKVKSGAQAGQAGGKARRAVTGA